MQRYIVRPSTSYIPRLTRAFTPKAQSGAKGDEKFNVAPAFPDDFEDSPLKAQILDEQSRARGVRDQGNKDPDHPNIYEIYESIQGKPPRPFKNAKTDKSAPKKRDPIEQEREPEIDEM